ncbi:benzoylformate decarboxylase [Bradyrhizobium cenepequi]|uniref:benzoylformate decarboxylase n=1 Tax=Bradyrhizobium cenepequi TaxID=2821403 RepID=UPI001CE38977|nr:benzoylformate decarboxylase [Bradyrhizobium cenepequi]MCA6109497.1 benzoylformate decarboxylase [Bradyrhizobium cenepequi]
MSSRKPATNSKAVTVKDATFGLLRALGIKKVFGNPGSTELPFLSDWPDDIDYVLGLQEASVVGMADGYAQATRNAGFVNLHSAAGVGHALGNVFNAYRNQTPLVITAGQQARSILPLQPFLYAERATDFPQPYVKWAVEPARPEDVPGAIARAYYIAMQPPCGPTFVSVPVDDWNRPTQPLEAREISREIGPDPTAMKALVAALAESKHPALIVGPAVDRAQAVDLMVKVAEKAKALVWASPFSARCSFPERHPQFAGFLHASPGQLSEALRDHDLVVVIGAPVFTFHVEGHAAIFDGATTLFQITDDASAASFTPVGNSIIGTVKPSLAMLLKALPETKRAVPTGRTLPPVPAAGDPIAAEFLMHSLSAAMGPDDVLVEEVPSHRPAMQKFMPMRGQDSFYTMASGGLGYSLPAAVGMALGRSACHIVCLIGDGSAMYSIQALWTAAQRKLPVTVVVINNAGYGAMRSFSQVMQVRNVPGLELPDIDFVKIAEGMGCHAVRVTKAAELSTALKRGLAHDGTSLVEVIVDSAVPLLYAQKG